MTVSIGNLDIAAGSLGGLSELDVSSQANGHAITIDGAFQNLKH